MRRVSASTRLSAVTARGGARGMRVVTMARDGTRARIRIARCLTDQHAHVQAASGRADCRTPMFFHGPPRAMMAMQLHLHYMFQGCR
ncbi:hypothetical protein DIE19_28755 [Burkholderia sp. Bp9126]|nr:hypothetical protein DIE19_28755 [Burkholderia sp. Bp9126]